MTVPLSEITSNSSNDDKWEALQFYFGRAYFYNRWRKRALRRLLTIVAPKMGRKAVLPGGDMGELSKVLEWLQYAWAPSMNHIAKSWDRYTMIPITEVIVEELCKKYKEKREPCITKTPTKSGLSTSAQQEPLPY